MNVVETIGMMSTGALLTIGAMQLFGGGNAVPPAEIAAASSTTYVTQEQPEVTRRANDMQTVERITQLESVVALSLEPLQQTEELTPAQLEVIAFFERTARQLNENNAANIGAAVRLNNMAIDRLNVRYFYTLAIPYDAESATTVMAEQTSLVHDILCSEGAILTLMNDYDFRYIYTYVSEDNRMIGQVLGDASSCA